jgi:hypothetical protein
MVGCSFLLVPADVLARNVICQRGGGTVARA